MAKESDIINFDTIVENIPFDQFKASFLSGEESALNDTLEKIKNADVKNPKQEKELQTFLGRIRKQLSDSDREHAKTKANDPLYNISYFSRAVAQMHPGFGPEGQKAGFKTEEFKSEVVKLYERYRDENLKLKNEREVNQLLTSLLGIAVTTLQDNHFNIKTSKGTRVYKDEEATVAKWTQNGKHPLKVNHPQKGNVGENVAHKPYQLTRILAQENIGTDERPMPLIVGERSVKNKTFGVVGLSSIFIHWGTPTQSREEEKVEKITKAFEKYHKNWDGVIIDVRGNTGGDGTASEKIVELLCGERPPYCLKATKRNTKESALREIGSPPIHEQEEWSPKTFHGSHEVFVLTDSKTGSASESFVPMLRHYEGATFIGENTNGCCQYGGTKPVRLPCGGIMQIGTVFRSYEDGMVECVGHKPDINCSGRDAFQVAIRQIEDKKNSLRKTLSNASNSYFSRWLNPLWLRKDRIKK